MISVITPSVRPQFLPIVDKCLKRQTYDNWEWLVSSPANYGFGVWVKEPPARREDYYGLNKAWNAAFKVAKGRLVVSIQDGIWFPPDLLQKFWDHYQANPKFCIGAVGDQYDQMENGRPEHCVWKDPRKRTDLGSFWEINPIDMEWCVASIPKQAILDVKGLKEKWDRFAALSEKEMNTRMDKIGYRFFLDSTIEYRAIKHDRLSIEWDKKYKEGINYFNECILKINKGEDLYGEL